MILSEQVKKLEEQLRKAQVDQTRAEAELLMMGVSMDRKLIAARAAAHLIPEEIRTMRSENVQLRAELEAAKTRELLLKSSSEEMRQWFREYHDLRRRMPTP